MARLTSLPNEILLEIFEQCNLNNEDRGCAALSLVCKGWRTLNDPILYSKVFLPTYYRLDKFLRTILSRPSLGDLVHQIQFPTCWSEFPTHRSKRANRIFDCEEGFGKAVEGLREDVRQLYFGTETISCTSNFAWLVVLLHYMPNIRALIIIVSIKVASPLTRYLEVKATPRPVSSIDAYPVSLRSLRT
jgi:F-box-like